MIVNPFISKLKTLVRTKLSGMCNQIGRKIDLVIGAIEHEAKYVTRAAGAEFYEVMAKKTRKDTGWAMSNWYISESGNPGNLYGANDRKSFGRITLQECYSIVEQRREEFESKISVLSKITIYNNVPYIEFLENRFGMVASTAQEFNLILRMKVTGSQVFK